MSQDKKLVKDPNFLFLIKGFQESQFPVLLGGSDRKILIEHKLKNLNSIIAFASGCCLACFGAMMVLKYAKEMHFPHRKRKNSDGMDRVITIFEKNSSGKMGCRNSVAMFSVLSEF